MNAKIKLLTFSGLYPNNTAPNFGIFVENRLRHVLASGEVDVRVVAPVPWFPLKSSAFGDYSRQAAVVRHEVRYGIDVQHPRYLHFPRIGVPLQPFMLYFAMRPVLARLRHSGYKFDLIDSHYFYPDGVAAALLASEFEVPFVVTSRGTDLVTMTKQSIPRRWIKWAARRANGLITVSASLKQELIDLGIEDDKVRVLRNGVDLIQFRPHDRDVVRKKYQFTRRTLVSVGHLIPRKGNEFIIRALVDLPDLDLAIAGEGPERNMLERLASDLGVGDRVRFLGVIPHQELAEFYSAADILVLASSHEGWPNVLLEAMACGTPVAATAVSGSPEIVTRPEAGLLMPDRKPETISIKISQLLKNMPDRRLTRSFSEEFSWTATTKGQLDLFRSILGGSSVRSYVS